jgi:hypothetical protein
MKRLLPALTPVALAAGALAVSAPRPAHALSCAGPRITMSPAADVAAPLNVRVVITIPLRTGLIQKPQELSLVRVDLRERAEPKKSVAVRRNDLGAGEQRQIELVPLAPLKPDVAYEVMLGRPDVSGTPPVVAGAFRTGQEADEAAPVWNGVTRATIAPRTRGHWGPSGPTASFHFAAAGDESTPNEHLRFGVWLPDAAGRFDYNQPPATYTTAHGGDFFLSGGSPCGWATFKFPIVTRLGVRVLDLAGNMGPASEVRLVPVSR